MNGPGADGALVAVTAITNTGSQRDENQDSIAVGSWSRTGSMSAPVEMLCSLEDRLLFLVADGMGGHAGGARASAHAVMRLCQMSRSLATGEAVDAALQRVSDEIHDASLRTPELRAMGTTAVGLLVDQDLVRWFNVGDSRLYQVRDGFLRQLSIDDSPVATAAGSEAEVTTSIITQSLGGTEQRVVIAPHHGSEPLADDSLYLLCSDGLSDVVEADDMEASLAEPADRAIVQSLFAKSIAGGAPDNVSIVLVRVLRPY